MDPATPLDGLKPKDFILSDEENRRIFEEQIRPAELGHLLLPAPHPHAEAEAEGEGRRRPLCVLVAGQTGAGKTRIAPAVAAALSLVRGGADTDTGTKASTYAYAHFIADTYKTYHPLYARLVRERPSLASPAAGPDARRWLARACEAAAAPGLRADCLVESACRNPGDFTSLAEAFAAAGYRVAVVLLAAHAAQSRLGVLARFLGDAPEARSRGLPLRLTPRVVHDESYAGLADVAKFVDGAEGVVDAVLVVRRGNLVGFEDVRGPDGRWVKGGGGGGGGAAAAALERERRRPGVEAEVRAFAADLERLRREHPEREAEFAEIGALYRAVQEGEKGEGEEGMGEEHPPLRETGFVDFIRGESSE